MENNRKFINPSKEEEIAFNEGLQELCKKHSMYIEIVPQFKPNNESKAYEIVGMLLVQKVVEETNAEVVSPIQHDELNKEA